MGLADLVAAEYSQTGSDQQQYRHENDDQKCYDEFCSEFHGPPPGSVQFYNSRSKITVLEEFVPADGDHGIYDAFEFTEEFNV